jgi:hypothetical protein
MVSVKQYSLLDYNLSVLLKESTDVLTGTLINIPIGGLGKYLGSITVTKDTANISKTVDATGAGVFSYTHDHSGTISIEISQLSDAVSSILSNIHEKYTGLSEGTSKYKSAILDITIKKGNSDVISATNCMLTKMPDLTLEAEAGSRTFEFLAMEIKEHSLTY